MCHTFKKTDTTTAAQFIVETVPSIGVKHNSMLQKLQADLSDIHPHRTIHF